MPDNGWIVLTGDQVVTHDGAILEKPLDIHQAKSFVSRYATSPPSTVGSVVLTHFPSGIQVSGVDSATIVFRPSVADYDVEWQGFGRFIVGGRCTDIKLCGWTHGRTCTCKTTY